MIVDGRQSKFGLGAGSKTEATPGMRTVREQVAGGDHEWCCEELGVVAIAAGSLFIRG